MDISAVATDPRSLPQRVGIMQRIAAAVPDSWRPAARRGLSRLGAIMSPSLRHRLERFLSRLRPEMGVIERDYPNWIEQYDRIDATAKRTINARIASMQNPPLISVLVPVFNPHPDHLRAALLSVRNQFYPYWELCIADDASTDPAVIQVLRNAAAHDHRIKLIHREQNGHISAASNSALTLATGDFVALLDHDDLLPPHALYEVAVTILSRPDVDIIYSDEDHIDDQGYRSHPYFKPDWNPDLMLGQNLISHLGVYRRALIERVGGFRVGFEGSQDHDLALRVVAQTAPGRIAHIPKVLYHWRRGSADRTFSEMANDRCVLNGRRAIADFVTRDRADAKVEPARLPIWTRVVYPVPKPEPLVSVIVAWNGRVEALLKCVDGLLNRTDYRALEVLIIATSPDAAITLPETLHADPRVRLMDYAPSPVNAAADAAQGTLLLLLDPDLDTAGPDWLREMVSHAVRPDVGAVGAKLLASDGTIRHAGIIVDRRGVTFYPFVGRKRSDGGYFGYLQLTRDVTAVSGSCLMVRRVAFIGVGGLDEAALPPAFRDVDLCLKLGSAGFRNVWTPHAELSSRNAAAALDPEAAVALIQATRLMRQRWGHRLDSDPYWSPNLSSDPSGMGLAFPPRDLAA